MKLRPGSFWWLVAHDLRIEWRQFLTMFNTSSRWVTIVLCAMGLLVLHLVASLAVDWLRPYLAPGSGDTNGLSPIDIAVVCILAWMISQGVLGTSRMLYDRGDLDLLMSSPLPVARVFATRVLALAISSFGSAGLLVLPVANSGTLLAGPSWLAFYPVLAALALGGTAFGAAIAMGLFCLFGPRRARLISQLSAAFLAGSFVLSVQVAALLPMATHDALVAAARASGLAGILALPVAATRGVPVAVLILTASSVAMFTAVVCLLANVFAHASVSAVDGTGQSGSARGERRRVRFRTGAGASLRTKEWRLLARDPGLFAQLSLQIIYTLPVAVLLLKGNNGFSLALGLAPVIVVVAVQISSSLAWIVVSAEDAPELIAAAPVTRGEVERGKLSALALPVVSILAAPLAGLALHSWHAALVTAAFAAMGAASGAALNLWHPMPGKRRGMLRRHSQSKIVALIEHFLAMLWAVAVVLGLLGSTLAVVPMIVAFAVLLGARRGWRTPDRSSVASHKLRPA
jgi:ABC-2 type transport system permease protein